MAICKICNAATFIGFNINLKLVNICGPCAKQIAYQEIKYMFEKPHEPKDSGDKNEIIKSSKCEICGWINGTPLDM